jgi:hypothetical protein
MESQASEPNCDDGGGEPDCKKATRYQLRKAGITDAHAFKDEYDAVPTSKFEICACKDGTIRIKRTGQCGRPGPSILTDAKWK